MPPPCGSASPEPAGPRALDEPPPPPRRDGGVGCEGAADGECGVADGELIESGPRRGGRVASAGDEP